MNTVTDHANKTGGLRPDLGPFSIWALSLGTSIGWGSLVVTSNTYLIQAGPWGSIGGILIGALIMILISLNYHYMINCFPDAGGAYSFTKETFGYDHGFLVAWFLFLTYIAVFWANATSLPLFARYFMGRIFQFTYLYTIFGYDVYLGEVILTITAILLAAIFCARWRKASMAVMTILVLLFTAGITICFLGAMIAHGKSGFSFQPGFLPDKNAISQIVKIACVSSWAFIGFENISHATEEYSFSRHKVLCILVTSVVVTTALYIFILMLSITAYPPQYGSWLEYIRDLGNLSGIEGLPAFYAANYYLGDFGLYALMASLLALVITSLIGNLFALSRLLYALAKDEIIPRTFSTLNEDSAPAKAIFLVAALSLPIPLLGRTTIGWIVDVTTIGATFTYCFVCFATFRTAVACEDKLEKWIGLLSFFMMIGFLAYLLLPNLFLTSSMARETYFLLVIWGILGFIYFRWILNRDKAKRFGKSVIVWVVLLFMVLFIALIWMNQSLIRTANQTLENIQEHYQSEIDLAEVRAADELFIEEEIDKLENANTRTMVTVTALFIFSLLVMLTNYSYMNKQAKEHQAIANTDPLTGVKSKHAFVTKEREVDEMIEDKLNVPFALTVCDVNGLKYINDTFGHKAGDEYIRSASTMICELFKHSPVYRIGGDEFVVVMVGGQDYENRDAIMAELQRRSEANIGTDNVIVAGGVSTFIPGQDLKMHDVFERADALMYKNKQALKNLGARTR